MSVENFVKHIKLKLFTKSGKLYQLFYRVLSVGVGVQVPLSNTGRSNMVWSLSPDIFGLQQGFLSNKEVVVGDFGWRFKTV